MRWIARHGPGAPLTIHRIANGAENSIPEAERYVGAVLSIRGAEACVGILSHGTLPDAEGTTVGVAIVSHNSILIGFVTQISVEVPEIARDQGYVASARLDLMGEIKADAQGSPRFLRGITEYPLIGDPVLAVGSNELRAVYGKHGDATINVGRLQQNASLSAHVNVDELLSRHFAVFGTTGVGKSSGIVLILQQVLQVRPNVRISTRQPQ